MTPYQRALTRFKMREETEKKREEMLPQGVDSRTPLYVQKLNALRGNEVHAAVNQSVNYDEPNLLESAVAMPGRMVHQIALGFVDSAADTVELPELLVNQVGDKLGWDEEDRINTLHSVADAIRGTVSREEAYNSV